MESLGLTVRLGESAREEAKDAGKEELGRYTFVVHFLGWVWYRPFLPWQKGYRNSETPYRGRPWIMVVDRHHLDCHWGNERQGGELPG